MGKNSFSQVLMSKRKATTSLTSRRKKAAKLIEELEDAQLPDLAEVEAIISEFQPPTRKRKRAPRKPTLRQSLLKKLRARKKVLKAELTGVERDIRSLAPRKRPRN